MADHRDAHERWIVTALGDADAEDYLAQLLFSQGWNIVHRGLDMDSVEGFVLAWRGAKLTLIYTLDFPGITLGLISALDQDSQITVVSIDNIPINAHALMTTIRGQLRAPLIHSDVAPIENTDVQQSPQLRSRVSPSQIVITGTVGAPGRTTLALALARRLAQEAPVELMDADLVAPCCEHFWRGEASLVIFDASTKATSLPDNELARVIDLGALGRLGADATDRRWQSVLRTNVLEGASSTIFVAAGTELGLHRLSEFISDLPILINKRNLIFVLNKSGKAKHDKALTAEFEKKVAGYPWERVSMDYSLHSALAAPTQLFMGENRFTKEVAKIANLIKR